MEEGQYTLRFALDETITVYHYNKRSKGTKITKEMFQNVTREQKSTVWYSTSYQLKPELAEFKDCVKYILTPPYFNVDIGDDKALTTQEILKPYISCTVYENILKNKTRSLLDLDLNYRRNNGLCAWNLLLHDKTFNITLNNSYIESLSQNVKDNQEFHGVKRGLKLALTCKPESSHSLRDAADDTKKIPTFVISFRINSLQTNSNDNSRAIRTALVSKSSKDVYYAIIIALCGAAVLIAATAVIISYNHKMNRTRYALKNLYLDLAQF